jgi:DNA repair protein RecN (Recombination protein N)
MLNQLSINNYALIDHLEIGFGKGFTVVTGETGAGKSIILGALGLILGERADSKALKSMDTKCVVEGTFNIDQYPINDFFTKYDLDYEKETLLRREILPSGKSRAFINDTPVNLVQLKELGSRLVDIHSQHQTLELNQGSFQLDAVDAYAQHQPLLADYALAFKKYKQLEKELETALEAEKKSKMDLDYFQFQFNELEEANLKSGEQTEIEQELNTLNNSEDIKTALNQVVSLMNEDVGILTLMREAKTALGKIEDVNKKIGAVANRIESASIELHDIASELEMLEGEVNHDPQKIQEFNDRLNMIYSLQQKHRVETIEELLQIKTELDQRIGNIGSLEEQIEKLTAEKEKQHALATKLSTKITNNRKKAIPKIEKEVNAILTSLAMSEAELKVWCTDREELGATGMDVIAFSFKTNKGGEHKPLNKIASGGELSRLMLAIKSIVSKLKTLPTIIFDEIDTGVSGDVADKVGGIMRVMASDMQVFSITHLPQIAGKGDQHYKVFKTTSKDNTETSMQAIDGEDRINEIAKMLSGEKLTKAAIENAKVLIGG